MLTNTDLHRAAAALSRLDGVVVNATYRGSPSMIVNDKGGAVVFSPDREDIQNAPFIIWGLDRLEELGMDPMLYQAGRSKITDSSEYVVQITVIAEDGVDGSAEMFSGDTRAEAVFLALLSALESTTQTDALEIPDSSSAAQSTAAEGEQEGDAK